MRALALLGRLIWIAALLPLHPATAAPVPAQPAVTGTVLGPDLRPVAGARVELLPVLPVFEQGLREIAQPGDPPPAVVDGTDEAGRFALQAPGPGIWKVVVRHAGMAPLQYAPLPLVGALELPPAELALDVGAPVRLIDPAGQPLAGAWIAAASPESGGGWRPARRLGRTDAQGALRLPRREGETMEVSVFVPGRAEVIRSGFTGGTIQVPAGGEVWRDVRLLRRTGEPVAGAVVQLGEHAWPLGRTDSQGRIRLPISTARATGSTLIRWLSEDGRLAFLQWSAPAPGAGTQERSLTLVDPLILSGRIVDGDSRKPISGMLVWASADPGAFVRSDGEGRFSLPVPTRRRFEVEVLAAGYLPRKVALPGPQLASGKGVTIALIRAGSVRGKVVDPQGRPLPDSRVVAVAEGALGERAFHPSDPVTDQAVTDSQGRFELRLLRPEQTYELRADRPGAFPAARRATVTDPAAPPRDITLVLAPARAARGKVQDPAGKPIADAEAVLRPARRSGVSPSGEDTAGITVRSDAKGVFSVAECPAAEVELSVRKKGYAPAVFPALRIPAGSGPADLGTVTLRPGARLAGRVVNSRGQAVPRAEVFLLDQPIGANDADRTLKGRKPAAITATDGRFAVEDLSSGTPVHVVTRAAGYLTAQARAVRPPTAQPLLIRLEPEAVLRGRVVNEEDDPVAGARIEVRWQAALPENPERPLGEPIFRGARSGSDGRFEVRGLSAGDVKLGAAAPGLVPIEGLDVHLPRPAEAGELRLVLARGATLQGRVTNASGQPVPAVRVGVGGSSAATDDDGLYWLEGAATGRQEVLFLHPSHGRLRRDFDVQPGINVLDVAFDPGVEVTGRVIDDSGKPVAGARVELGSENRFELRIYRDVTGEDGRFRLSPVADGRYRLRAEAEGFTRSELAETLAVAGEPISNLELTLDKGATLSGRILGLSSEDLAQVEVEARSDGGDVVAAWTDGRGRYEVPSLAPGDWTVRAALWDDQRHAQTRLAIRRSDRNLTRDLEFEERLTLTAQVLHDEEPLPEARFSLRGQRIAVERAAMTDHEGRVRFQDLEPDAYRIGITHARSMLLHNDQVDLQQDREIVIRLQSATVSGLVVSAAGGQPIAKALLSMRPVEGPEYLITAGTEADGRFTLYRVQPGRYRIQARAQGFTPADQEIQVAGGQTIDNLEFRLSPAAGARLQVRLASGQVPSFVHLQVRNAAGGTVLAETRQTDASGIVKLSMLPAGAWSVLLRAEGSALATASLQVPSPEPVAVTLPPAGDLLVRVPALLDSTLIGTVRLLGPDQQPFWTIGPGGKVLQQWPLVGGKTLIEGVPAGTWVLQVETPDGKRWQGTATTAGIGKAAVTIE